jgi:hypothetical protein
MLAATRWTRLGAVGERHRRRAKRAGSSRPREAIPVERWDEFDGWLACQRHPNG